MKESVPVPSVSKLTLVSELVVIVHEVLVENRLGTTAAFN